MELFTDISSIGEIHLEDFGILLIMAWRAQFLITQWWKDFLLDILFLWSATMSHSFLKHSLLVLPRVKIKRQVFEPCLVKPSASVTVPGRLLGKRSRAPVWGLPGIASTSTCLQILFYPVVEYLRFCFYKIPLLYNCLKAITLGNWGYCTQKNKSLLFDELFWIVHISKRWNMCLLSSVSVTSSALVGMLGIFFFHNKISLCFVRPFYVIKKLYIYTYNTYILNLYILNFKSLFWGMIDRPKTTYLMYIVEN